MGENTIPFFVDTRNGCWVQSFCSEQREKEYFLFGTTFTPHQHAIHTSLFEVFTTTQIGFWILDFLFGVKQRQQPARMPGKFQAFSSRKICNESDHHDHPFRGQDRTGRSRV